jgi:hypothetical protein
MLCGPRKPINKAPSCKGFSIPAFVGNSTVLRLLHYLFFLQEPRRSLIEHRPNIFRPPLYEKQKNNFFQPHAHPYPCGLMHPYHQGLRGHTRQLVIAHSPGHVARQPLPLRLLHPVCIGKRPRRYRRAVRLGPGSFTRKSDKATCRLCRVVAPGARPLFALRSGCHTGTANGGA